MLGQRWLCGLLILSWALAQAQELEPYLKLRQQHKIQSLTPIAGLELAVGSRVLEVEGMIRGSVASGDQRSILLEASPNRSIVVQISEGHDWLTRGQFRIRAIVRVTRQSELVSPEYQLLGAVYESVFRRWEASPKAQQASSSPAKPPQKATPPARGNTSSRGNPPKRNPHPNLTITDWQQFAQNLDAYVPVYADAIQHFNRRLPRAQAEQIARAILYFSAQHGVDPRFIMAIVLVESGFNPNATSPKGAMGLGQLMPGTARGLGVVDPYDPIQNLEATVRLVRGHLVKYWNQTGDPNGWDHVILALAAYNAGSGAVRRHGGVPPYKETQNYIRKVISVYKRLCGVPE